MELTWLLLPVATCLLLIPLVFVLSRASNHRRLLPPGPTAIPILGTLEWLTITSGTEYLRILRRLHSHHGPLLVHRFGSYREVTVADRRLAHAALVDGGAAVADRPAEMAPHDRLGPFTAFTINAQSYGPRWGLLRRNLASEVANPARIRQLAQSRERAVSELIGKLRREQQGRAPGAAVGVRDAFQHAMYSLAITMCFGEVVEDSAVRRVTAAMRDFILYTATQFDVFLYLPAVTTRLFRGRLQALEDKRQKAHSYFLPMISARRQSKQQQLLGHQPSTTSPRSYLDSLLDIVRLDEDGGGSLTDDEIAALCSELITAATDLPVTALEWTMAEIVKNPGIQEKLYQEIKATTATSSSGSSSNSMHMVSEEDLPKMPYLKAVVLEGLRRHPPGHILVPHAAREDVELGGYVIPKGTAVNFMVYDLGMDERTWDRPTVFMPERFLPGGDGEALDITGTKEIKMIPFGAGRRLCPGLNIALLHLEYFVANLVAAFDWQECQGKDVVDVTSEEGQFSIVMGKPLRAHLASRLSA